MQFFNSVGVFFCPLGKWDRSEMEKSFVEISEYTDREGNKEFFEHLGLFQQHKEYDVMT